jgi:hypothetical protein
MAHFAKIVTTNNHAFVEQVIVAEQDFIDTLPGEWIQTSYNTHGGVHTSGGIPLRKNYAGIGYIYDRALDAFYPPRPNAQFILNTSTCLWEAPFPAPEGVDVYWDTRLGNWAKSKARISAVV